MLNEKIMESIRFIESKTNLRPEIAVVLGSGLGYFADKITDACSIPYADIPHFVKSTVESHASRMVIGKVCGKTILCMQGRFHYYEGYSMQEITYPIRMMKKLGIQKLILTNACGGLDYSFKPGDFMLISDHINFTGANPLIGPNEDEFGPRFPDMNNAYDPQIREVILKAAEEIGIKLREGIYIGYSGPSFETPAEIKLFQSFGCHAVGMSTVPEVITARHCGLRVAAISCVTNLAASVLTEPPSMEEVIEAADKAAPKFIQLLEKSIEAL